MGEKRHKRSFGYVETPGGCIDGGNLTSMSIITRKNAGLGRTYYTPTETLVSIGKGLLVGRGVGELCERLGVNRKLVYRIYKKLGLGRMVRKAGSGGFVWEFVVREMGDK